MNCAKLIKRLVVAFACLVTIATAQAAPMVNYFADREDVRQFVSEMVQQHGFSEPELLALFAATPVLPNVITLIKPPADPQSKSWIAYRQRFVEPKRIAAGRRFMAQHADALALAESRYGVPREIVAAIIGVETIYGRNTGRVNTLAALSTLTFDYPPRAELFRRELSEFLLLARDAKRDPRSYKSSYAGALGLPQFLPSSIRAFAIDFNDDGHIDIATSPADAVGSVARFLTLHGWREGEPIAFNVDASGDGLAEVLSNGVLPSFYPDTFEKLNVMVSPVDGGAKCQAGTADPLSSRNAVLCASPASPLPNLPSALIDFTSPNAPTEYRLGYQNFYVITRYNRSRFYAAAVMDLAAVLAAK